MFGEDAGVPLIYLLSAASPTDPSRKSLVEYLTTGDWPALSSSGMASWTGILEKIGGDYEDVRDEVFQDEPMSVEPEASTLTMRESNQSRREGSGEAAQIGSTTSLRTRNRSRGSLLSLGGGGGGGKRQRGGRGGRGAAGGRTSSLGRGRRGLLASPAARRSRENLYEAPPSAAKSEGRAEAIEESSQSPVRAAAPARSLFGRGSASPAARRRRGSRSRASSQDRRRESLGSIRAEIAGSASRASGAGSQVDVGVSQPDLRGSRMSLRGRQRRGLFQGRSASRERAGSVESVGRGRGGGGERRGGLLGGRSRSRGRLVQSRAELSQGTDGEVEESRPVGGGVGQEGGRRGRARAKSQQHLGERGEEAGERQGRRGAGSLPRKREPIRRSQSTWSVR